VQDGRAKLGYSRQKGRLYLSFEAVFRACSYLVQKTRSFAGTEVVLRSRICQNGSVKVGPGDQGLLQTSESESESVVV
jgi:hypothetical protein